MRSSTDSPFTISKFSLRLRSEVQANVPEPAGKSQPVLRFGLVRKRKPPDARTTNSFWRAAATVASVERSPYTKEPWNPLVDALEPSATVDVPLAVFRWPIATA